MLGLKVSTDAGWAAAAMRDADAVLVDHAHCELKAASNALSLVARHPGDPTLSRALAELAREEIEHYQRVLDALAARGVPVGAPPVDTYAAELRRAAAEVPRDAGIKNGVLVDRLLVGALIEARSCERFQLLAQAAEGVDDELHALWRDLLAAEARHYRTFVDLAVRAAGDDRSRVVERLDRLAEAEAAIVTRIAADAAGVGPPGEVSRASIHG